MDHTPTPPPVIGETKLRQIASKNNPEKKSFLLQWSVILIIILVILLGGLLVYQRFIAPALVKPVPSPSPTAPAWKTQSEQTVTNFINLWTKSSGSQNAQNAQDAKNLLTLTAQSTLANFQNSSGQLITNLSDELTAFVGTSPPTQSVISNIVQIDEQTVEATVVFKGQTQITKIFTTKAVGDSYLIDSVRNWGS